MVTHIGTQIIETQRLILRKFEYFDDEAMLKYWVADPRVQHMYLEPIYTTKKEVKELLDKYIGSYEKNDSYRWAITLKETGECIGQIAYFLIDNKNNFGEIEYCIGKSFQNLGLVTEAARAIISFGFLSIGLHKVQVSHMSINPASKRVIEKCGFLYEGCLRDYFFVDGKYIDRLFYSILESEFEK